MEPLHACEHAAMQPRHQNVPRGTGRTPKDEQEHEAVWECMDRGVRAGHTKTRPATPTGEVSEVATWESKVLV